MPHLPETHPSRRPVVVGVDGSRAAYQAVRWGAVEARLRAAKLLLVHVGPLAADAVGLDHTSPPGDAILRTSAEVAAETEPAIGLETMSTKSTSVSEELVRISHDAEVLALGIDLTRTRSSHGARGPLEDRVAVHASCPVAVVAPLSFIAVRSHTGDRRVDGQPHCRSGAPRRG